MKNDLRKGVVPPAAPDLEARRTATGRLVRRFRLAALLCAAVFVASSCGRPTQTSSYEEACQAIGKDSFADFKLALEKDPSAAMTRDGFDRSTLLHRISARSHILPNCEEWAGLLLACGADINAQDSTGKTPLDIASRFSAPEHYIEFLKDAAKRQNEQPDAEAETDQEAGL